MGNRERIIETTLRLMNELGAEAIGTNRIAAETGVSPGNLYYHFSNREEIVRALFDALEEEFHDVLQRDVNRPLSPERIATFYLRTFDLAWRYRFFFSGTLGLLRRDAVLAARYQELQSWAIAELGSIAAGIADDGNLTHPRGEAGIASLALNTWLIWSNWIGFLQISGIAAIQRDDMTAGINQLFDVIAPYLVPGLEESIRRGIADHWAP